MMAVKKNMDAIRKKLDAKVKRMESASHEKETPATKEQIARARAAGGDLADPHEDDLYDPDHEIPYAGE
jgi:hypothetical protein